MEYLEELKNISFFEELNQDELKLLSSISKKKYFNKGEVVFYEKESSKHLILLTSGILKVYKTDSKNNEIVLNRFKPNSLIAEMAVFEGIAYPASASFETNGSLIEIDFELFKDKFLSNKYVAFSFFKSLSRKIKSLENVISLNIVLDSTARVAKYICENDEALSMKNNQLAKYLHMTPETLSRIFNKFIKLGFIIKDGSSYKIINRSSLEILFE